MQANAERAAVVAKIGLDALDTYRAAQPVLLWGGAAGAALSVAMLVKRRRVPEAYGLYLTTLGVSLAAIWAGLPSRASAAAAPQGGSGPNVLGWLDAKRAEFRAKDPQWVARTRQRVLALPGVQAQLDSSPLLRAVVG